MAAIVFDFDGTIADSFEYVSDFLAREAGKSPLSAEQKRELRGKSMAAIGRQLGHSWWRLLRLFFKGRQQMVGAIDYVDPFQDMPEVIEKLHAEGHQLFIVSSNTVANVQAFLRKHELHTYFLEIYGSAGLFGKTPILRRLLKEQHFTKQDVIYVGDEVRDVQAAQSLHIRIVAVTWGFARPRDLEALKPTALADGPSDLLRILEET